MENRPVIDCIERIFIGDVIHEDETHSASVVCGGDGPVPLLSCCVLPGGCFCVSFWVLLRMLLCLCVFLCMPLFISLCFYVCLCVSLYVCFCGPFFMSFVFFMLSLCVSAFAFCGILESFRIFLYFGMYFLMFF